MKQALTKIGRHLQSELSFDLRALALMRIGLGFVLALDGLIRLESAEAHHGANGTFPRELLFDGYWREESFSLYLLSDDIIWVKFLLLLQAGCGLLLMAGYRTKLFTIISWILLVSVQRINPFILQSGDDFLRITLFWCMFLPWGKRYSADCILSEESRSDNRYMSVPAIGYALVVFSIYFFTAVLKDSDEWRTEGTALYYALSLDQMILPIGKFSLQFPELLKWVTKSVLWMEFIAPVLIFIPYKNALFRGTAVFSIILLHLFISLHLFVGLFFMIGLSTAIGLLPEKIMNRIEKPLINIGKSLSTPLANIIGYRKKFTFKWPVDPFYPKFLFNCLLVYIIAYSLLWNFMTLHQKPISLDKEKMSIGFYLHLDQNWSMFAPSVLKDDGWFILEGVTSQGDTIDINRGGKKIDYTKPKNFLHYIRDDRWRKNYENLMLAHNGKIRPAFSWYHLKKWNREHPEKRITKFRLIYMLETTLPDYQKSKITEEVLFETSTNE